MKLKNFQQVVLDKFDNYLHELVESYEKLLEIKTTLLKTHPDINNILPDFTEKAWESMRNKGELPNSQKKNFNTRTDGIGNPVPSVTFKIPTGGGKTLLAASAVSRIMSKWVGSNYGFVLWIVPSESIYTQTFRALNDREHPYRQILDQAAAGRIKILEKTSPICKKDVEANLCIMLLMLQSSNRENKETLKIFKDRGDIHGFFPSEDDIEGQNVVLEGITNLDSYGENDFAGRIIKDSLGNALRVIRPVVVIDEGHKSYTPLAMSTLYGFNPCFVLELSATPIAPPNNLIENCFFSNLLVNVKGVELDKEEMIKLPINIVVREDNNWKECLRLSVEHLNQLDEKAKQFQYNTGRYIRPICLIQAERTGKNDYEDKFIHANEVHAHLLKMGVKNESIAIKTSSQNDLNSPENMELQSPRNLIRFIITRQALQEGWDCSFAYVLCSLAPMSSQKAMTQLVGRILRQPDTIKTGIEELDQCYVFCNYATTSAVVKIIKDGLEQDGMSDLENQVSASDSNRIEEFPRVVNRREKFVDLKLYLPTINWVENNIVRPLDYERDILYQINWSKVDIDNLLRELPENRQSLQTQIAKINFTDVADSEVFIEISKITQNSTKETFDPVYISRALIDIVPNPWIARDFVEKVKINLIKYGNDSKILAINNNFILEIMRLHLTSERDRLAEMLFRQFIEEGLIQFRLRTDSNNWIIPKSITTTESVNSQLLRRDNNQKIQKDLFESTYVNDLNQYEQMVACFLDGNQAIDWWYRNVAKKNYSLQGWKKYKIFPDFIVAFDKNNKQHLMILETKGNHLDGTDSEYKKSVMDLCTKYYSIENVTTHGQLELVSTHNTTVTCNMVFENNWKNELITLIDG